MNVMEGLTRKHDEDVDGLLQNSEECGIELTQFDADDAPPPLISLMILMTNKVMN